MEIEKLIQENLASIVDVRSGMEFAGGHVAGSINIPLGAIASRLDEVKEIKGPIVLCCASGGRSAQAHRFLRGEGVECYDGGSWLDVNYFQAKTI